MNIQLIRAEEPFVFRAHDGEGHCVNLDANPLIGGKGTGMRPMELLLSSVAGCASIDLGLILKKQRQQVDDYSVEVIGKRKQDKSKAFSAIHLHFVLKGELNREKVDRAINLTINEYCSVILSLSKEIEITYSFEINEHES